MVRKAVQQIMLGTVTKTEAQAADTLNAIKAAGYDSIELNGFMIRPASMMVRLMTKAAGMPVGKGGNFDWGSLLRDTGLQVASIHEDLGRIKNDVDGVIQEAKGYGAPFVVVTGMYRFDYSDEAALHQLCVSLNEQGVKLSEAGISLLYHNHNCELRRLGDTDETAYDYILSHTDPAAVGFEFDSYWFTEGGASALSWMEKLGPRMKLWHINDRGTRLSGPSMTPILKSDSMELGYGNMPLKTLAEQAKRNGVEGVILESHKNWVDKSPIKSLQLSSEFMKTQIAR